jgi:hypothetical protein
VNEFRVMLDSLSSLSMFSSVMLKAFKKYSFFVPAKIFNFSSKIYKSTKKGLKSA